MLCWESSWESQSTKRYGVGGAWLGSRRQEWELPHLNAPAASLRRITMTADEQTTDMPSPSQTLVLYDGVCGLCNRLVAFLLRHDRNDQFRFAPLQSPMAQTLLRRYGLDPKDFDSVVVIANFGQPSERALTRSAAALMSLDRVGGIWRLAGVGKLIPHPLRETLYKFIARHRYQVFGKHDVCPLPKAEDRGKFLSF